MFFRILDEAVGVGRAVERERSATTGLDRPLRRQLDERAPMTSSSEPRSSHQ